MKESAKIYIQQCNIIGNFAYIGGVTAIENEALIQIVDSSIVFNSAISSSISYFF